MVCCRTVCQRGGMRGDAVRGAPDFARLYAGPGSPLSPRMVARLWATAVTLAETYDEGRWHLLRWSLPPIVQRLADEVWMERFVACFEALARRVERGAFDANQITTCTAEEMALHLVIDAAEGATADGRLALTSRCRRASTVTRTSTPFGSSTSATTTFCCFLMPPWTGSRRPTRRSVSMASLRICTHRTGLVPPI